MVSAAKLRRAQERALAARPYAQMLTNVLKSLVSRAEIYDPETGEPRHPLLARRPEKNVLLIVVTGDKGLAGAFNTNILKAAMRFIATKSGKNISRLKPSAARAAIFCDGVIAPPSQEPLSRRDQHKPPLWASSWDLPASVRGHRAARSRRPHAPRCRRPGASRRRGHGRHRRHGAEPREDAHAVDRRIRSPGSTATSSRGATFAT